MRAFSGALLLAMMMRTTRALVLLRGRRARPRRFASSSSSSLSSSSTTTVAKVASKDDLFDETFAVAPMMDYTDRYFRKLFRQLSRRAVLYTEMVAANTLCDEAGKRRYENLDRWLAHDDVEAGGGTVLQLGGAHPGQLRHAARLAADYGYAGINLNCGCPSERVAGSGCFGAALMKSPALVAKCCAALAEGAGPDVPITVKCRVGVVQKARDVRRRDEDIDVEYAELRDFIQIVSDGAPVRRFVMHARAAVLSGLSPHANRQVPPLRPELVDRLGADDFGHAHSYVFNGVVDSYETARDRLDNVRGVDGVMVGRDACKRPWYWATADTRLCGTSEDPAPSRRAVLAEYAAYARVHEEAARAQGRRNRPTLLKPLHGLFHGDPGSSAFKRQLDRLMKANDETLNFEDLVHRAATMVPDDLLDAPPSEYLSRQNLRRSRDGAADDDDDDDPAREKNAADDDDDDDPAREKNAVLEDDGLDRAAPTVAHAGASSSSSSSY